MHPTDSWTIQLAVQDWFYVGGQKIADGAHEYRRGAMYVERYVPAESRQTLPVVMWHGGVQTGTNFVATADGRRGWLHDFLRAGYTVYVVDQPERGRSGHALSSEASSDRSTAALLRYDAKRTEERFTGTAESALWPQARLHTQWPGSGRRGDSTFERFFASQVDQLRDRSEIEVLNRDAGIALLEEIGPAILLTHSQSGPFGWLVADASPDKVKGILAIEPNGPPFVEVRLRSSRDPQGGQQSWWEYEQEISRPHGIAREPLTWQPALAPGEALSMERRELAAGTDRIPGYLQAAPARQLANLRDCPILIVTGEASYHAVYDHVTSAFLRQAGVAHDVVRLEEVGMRGNGHMIMMEKNNHEVADLLIGWLEKKL